MLTAQELHKIANELRADVLRMVFAAKAGHVAGPLSGADIVATLYFSGLVDHKQDKIILSCGHYVPVQYAALARAGRLPISELETFMQSGGRLPGHPERGSVPGIEVSAGPLGQGASVAVGMALGFKMRGSGERVYCMISDGEMQEGQVWEAFNLAVAKKLDNLTYVMDMNGIQIGHYTSEIVETGNIAGRIEGFGLHTIEINGNRIDQIQRAFLQVNQVFERPTLIVAKTVAGKGVGFMENDPVWHDRVPTKEELELALKELNG